MKRFVLDLTMAVSLLVALASCYYPSDYAHHPATQEWLDLGVIRIPPDWSYDCHPGLDPGSDAKGFGLYR